MEAQNPTVPLKMGSPDLVGLRRCVSAGSRQTGLLRALWRHKIKQGSCGGNHPAGHGGGWCR
jgi:hypothetical protein